ncbi:MAG: hypothetical protein IMW92_01690 [Bacillales bacterium]|nr:hypothetical protein [Bacillales bacterium]
MLQWEKVESGQMFLVVMNDDRAAGGRESVLYHLKIRIMKEFQRGLLNCLLNILTSTK